jgi:DNA-binding transcriptional LysR family regulator
MTLDLAPPSDQVYQDILENRADLGLIAYPGDNGNISSVRFRNELLVAACYPRHPLAREKMIKLKVFKKLQLVGIKSEKATGIHGKACSTYRGMGLNYIAQLDELEAVKQAV